MVIGAVLLIVGGSVLGNIAQDATGIFTGIGLVWGAAAVFAAAMFTVTGILGLKAADGSQGKATAALALGILWTVGFGAHLVFSLVNHSAELGQCFIPAVSVFFAIAAWQVRADIKAVTPAEEDPFRKK